MGIYADRVTEALTAWRSNLPLDLDDVVSDFELLLQALDAYETSEEALADKGEPLVRGVLLTVFELYTTRQVSYAVNYDLFIRLLAHDRWRSFERLEIAHAFTSTGIKHLEQRAVWITVVKDDSLRIAFAEALSEWLAPDITIQNAKPRDVAVALFGEAWCTLIGDTRFAGKLLGDVIAAQKPDFLPGRLLHSFGRNAYTLPDITF